MKVLVIKMSSLGDVIHCLPAVTDLCQHHPNAVVDWVVEEGFTDIPELHSGIDRVLPIALRRWRKSWWASRSEFMDFRKSLQAQSYDLVIDAQGLLKSAMVGQLARGKLVGFDRASVREPAASLFYREGYQVSKDLHAIRRLRELFAQALGYSISESLHSGLQYGLKNPPALEAQPTSGKEIFFFHGTTWLSKHWPVENWIELAHLCLAAGYGVVVPYLGSAEKAHAAQIAAKVKGVRLLPPGSIAQMGAELSFAAGAVSVDTGLGHLAAAYNTPLIGIYGPTDHQLTGIIGSRQASLSDSRLNCAPCLNRTCRYEEEMNRTFPPCFEFVTPEKVFEALNQQMMVR